MSIPPFLPPPDIEGASAYDRWGDHRHLSAALGMVSRVMFLTGAGLSAPSGIPTYRGRGGKWTVSKPVLHGEFVSDAGARAEQWRRSCDDLDAFAGARPNPGHDALARLSARTGAFLATQNVDGLHGESGFPADRMVELHGNGRRARCLRCDAAFPLDVAAVRSCLGEGRDPACGCGGLLKPDVTLFGANLDKGVLSRAVEEARGCIAFVAVGTSLNVQPAAGLAEVAVENGGVLVIVNDGITPYHGAAHLLVAGDASACLAEAVPA